MQQLFDAMAANDSASAAAVFHPAARITRASDQRMTFRSAHGLTQMIASTDEQHEELIWDLVVNVDGTLAQAWAKYAFYRDGAFLALRFERLLALQGPKGLAGHPARGHPAHRGVLVPARARADG